MILRLPNGDKIKLDTSLSLEERKAKVNDILDEWQDYFEKTWQLKKTKVCLEILSNYLCLVKDGEKKNTEDKYILSLRRTKEIKDGTSKYTNFSDLSIDNKLMFGLTEENESGE